jgi:predicted PurR-regulated permease PerM
MGGLNSVAKASIAPVWQRALIILTSAVVSTIVVSCLYWAQKICIPVALAVFLTFLLAPLVTILQRRGLGRTPSAILVVLLAVLVLGGVGWLVTTEVKSLADDVPTYTENIKGKIRSLRQLSDGSFMERLDKMVQDIAGEWVSQPTELKEGAADLPAGSGGAALEKPVTVVPQPQGSALLSRVPALVGPAAESLAGLALALVLVVFMLLKREDLRNRLIRLVGHGRMTVMTKAVDDAGQRISRFLVMQLIVNGSFGLALSIGLFAIQVPHALLWGFLATVLRYVPYLGSWIMATLLVALSLAFFPGWLQPCLVLGLIVVLEVVTANVMEPRLFGHSMGISEVGLMVAAAFWAFLWGPVGLVLSSPLTVCLVVLGKYVPHLEFLDVLLGNEQALDADVSYYQRLLARDQDEATQLVLTQAKTSSLEQVYDGILVPALNYLKRDRARDDLTDADEHFVLRATQEIVEDLGGRQVAAVKLADVPVKASADPAPRKVQVLACPGHDEADRLALEMFRQILDPTRWNVEMLSIEMLSAEMVALAGEKKPAVVCIGAMPPGGLAHTRHLCRRLRARLPDAKIVVGRWGLRTDLEENQEQLREAGADQVEMNLLETCNHLHEWLPVLTQEKGVPPQKIAG